jgi:hypothetical protein
MGGDDDEDRWETQDKGKQNKRYDRSCSMQNGGFDGDGNWRDD